ncbi:thioesterase domain-containing protein [Acaryochloris marina]|uniref:Thioesterase putative domain-containing protein n=1 Tax=Acaryochloris marina (strain MBIC 11017) TaxID=329726 RepID=B0C1D1_ACAM1|nr:thioesterase domain-containing protein [Acaryochloris marina]ABW29666.1 conserved hypothetical protein [Acaryochloris marina MBIC11017]BDM78565.1 hypothetical protein AM10699_14340 [Acaryochloris marina MBIC10699]
MTSDCTAVEQYLHEHIPISAAMAVTVSAIHPQVILSVPLQPNINHRQTGFGGSISTLAILSAWTFVHIQLQPLPKPYRIVIQDNSVEYLQPVTSDFEARCASPSPETWQRFLKILQRKGKSRIQLAAEVYAVDQLVGTFTGNYVALDIQKA